MYYFILVYTKNQNQNHSAKVSFDPAAFNSSRLIWKHENCTRASVILNAQFHHTAAREVISPPPLRTNVDWQKIVQVGLQVVLSFYPALLHLCVEEAKGAGKT